MKQKFKPGWQTVRHGCALPSVKDLRESGMLPGPGSVFACNFLPDSCGSHWMLTYQPMVPESKILIPAWHRIATDSAPELFIKAAEYLPRP